MLFVCARYESLCTCSSTSSCNLNHTHTHKKELDKTAPHPLGHHIVKCELEVWFW